MGENGNGTNGTLASNRAAMDRFLEKLRNSGNVRNSCKAAGIPRRTAYNWREKWATFRDEWDDALEDACDALEGEAWRRAVDESSDRLLMFLLKAHRPDRFAERTKQEVDVTSGGERIASEPDLDALAAAIASLKPGECEGGCGGCQS